MKSDTIQTNPKLVNVNRIVFYKRRIRRVVLFYIVILVISAVPIIICDVNLVSSVYIIVIEAINPLLT